VTDSTRSLGKPPVEPVQQHTGYWRGAWKRFRRNGLAVSGLVIVLSFLLLAIFAPWIATHPPEELAISSRLVAPSFEHWLGTDNLGRDIFSRIVYGSRVTMAVGFGMVSLAALIGAPLGAIAGYFGGTWLDEVLMRIFDVFIAFPTVILAIAVMGTVGTGTFEVGPFTFGNIAKVVLVGGLVLAPRLARVVRSSVLKERPQDYIEAARCIGASDRTILLSEILPNALVPLIIQATYYFATAVLTEAALSFLGIGVQPPQPSWGQMLSQAQAYIFGGEWWFSVFPGLGIFLVMVGFNLLGDGMRDALDPQLDGSVT
jgi:peptide/nickel transport system permease protein/dipeptide transport system permease protein